MATITSLLEEIREGRRGAEDRLYSYVYEDLKEVARQQLRNRRAGVLHATALVNAAYERLALKEALDASDRRHLFYLFSRAMHDVLVEQVRHDLAMKRGGRQRPVPLLEIAVDGTAERVELLDLEDALCELTVADPDAARIVMLRFYSGLTLEEAASVAGFSFAVARRHWEYARAWMHERLSASRSRWPGEK